MKIKKITVVFLILFFLPAWLMSQNENVDLSMIYKIKQEGLKNSGIEDLAFWLTDFVGPRLTASTDTTVEMNGQKRKWKNWAFRMSELKLPGISAVVAGIILKPMQR